MQITFVIPLLLFLVFLFLSLLHIYWAFGGQWGSADAVPTKDNDVKVFSPGPLATCVVAVGLLAMGIFVLAEGKLIGLPVPWWLNQYGLWGLAAVFIIRAIGDFKYVGFFKKIRHTKFGRNDTWYYSPLCLIIGGLTIVVELTK